MKKRIALIVARGDKDQGEVAKMVGVAQQTYSHWERGRTTPPIRKMLVIEKVLGVPKEQLFPDVFGAQSVVSDERKSA